jgi:DNA-binding PadR family transcriptional regulator
MPAVRKELTELERCVLGVIWRDGPLTAYEIAALFAKSLSPYWSGSAGAIYPAVKRLRGRGLISGQQRAWNGAKKTVVRITKKGIVSLRDWLTPPIAAEAAAPAFDSIRTRLFFLEVLPLRERRAIVDDAIRATKEHIRRFEQRRAEDMAAGDVSEVLGGVGVIYEYKARLQWLSAIRRYVATGRLPRWPRT